MQQGLPPICSQLQLSQGSVSWGDAGWVLRCLQLQAYGSAYSATLGDDPKTKEVIKQVLLEIASRTESLQNRWDDDRSRAPSPAAYLEQLNDDRRMIVLALQTNITRDSAARVLASLKAVADDLAVKNAYCDAGGTWASLVTVSVSALRKNQAINGFEVWYAPFAWQDVAEHWNRFGGLTSPADCQLPPGRYAVALKNPGSSTPVASSVMSVGRDGKPTTTFQLGLPTLQQ